jgi:hypothetical protein
MYVSVWVGVRGNGSSCTYSGNDCSPLYSSRLTLATLAPCHLKSQRCESVTGAWCSANSKDMSTLHLPRAVASCCLADGLSLLPASAEAFATALKQQVNHIDVSRIHMMTFTEQMHGLGLNICAWVETPRVQPSAQFSMQEAVGVKHATTSR